MVTSFARNVCNSCASDGEVVVGVVSTYELGAGVQILKACLLCKTRPGLFGLACLLCLLSGPLACAEFSAVKQRLMASPVLAIMYSDWSVNDTLVTQIYALYPPSGRFAPAFVDLASGRVGSIRGWQDVAEGGLQKLSKDDARAMRRALISRLDWAQGIKRVYGQGIVRAMLFSAFDCPNCQRFEAQLATHGANLNAILYLFPQTLHANDADKADLVREVWCSDDPYKAWQRLVAGHLPKQTMHTNCEKGNKRATELSDMLGVQGVPALVTSDGRVLQGFVDAPMATLEAALRP